MFLPALILFIPSGVLADRFNRRLIVVTGRYGEVLCSLGFIALILGRVDAVWPYLAIIFVLGAARGVSAPAQRTLLPNIVDSDHYVTAQATYVSARELAWIAAPVAGGALIAASTATALAVAGGLSFLAALLLTVLRVRNDARVPQAQSWSTALAGLAFIRSQQVILGAISLDLVAVLFGGPYALLPIFADVILKIGPFGLGVLSAARAVGASLVAFVLAGRPPERHVGRTLFIVVSGFAVASILFGLSRSAWLSFVALALMGGFDVVSVVIRSALIQLNTPDEMRGRVSAVESIFITASAQLGAFESGTAAALIGTVPSVIFGGVTTLAVLAIWAVLFPRLRDADQIRAEA
jgi:MFS family permease